MGKLIPFSPEKFFDVSNIVCVEGKETARGIINEEKIKLWKRCSKSGYKFCRKIPQGMERMDYSEWRENKIRIRKSNSY